LKKPPKRAKRGSVAILSKSGMLRIRFTFQGQRLERALALPDTRDNRKVGEAIAKRIEADIAYDRFTLANLSSYLPNAVWSVPSLKGSTAEFFQIYIDVKRRSGISATRIAAHYEPLLSHLARWTGPISTHTAANSFAEQSLAHQAPITRNGNHATLQAFGQWLVDEGKATLNPFEKLPKIKGARDRAKRAPFTTQEVQRILVVAQAHPRHHWAHDFLLCLFTLGLRPSEAIGLRWRDYDGTTISVTTALGRGLGGRTSSQARRRRRPKGSDQGNRVLPVSSALAVALDARRRPADPEALIFTAVKGGAIDDHNFSQRVWRDLLKQAGIPHRPLYTTRHTCASHLVEAGANLIQASRFLGHRDTTMLAKVYGHALSLPPPPTY
jgi:integrase